MGTASGRARPGMPIPGRPVMEVINGPRAAAQASVRRMDMGPATRKNNRISCTPGDPEWL